MEFAFRTGTGVLSIKVVAVVVVVVATAAAVVAVVAAAAAAGAAVAVAIVVVVVVSISRGSHWIVAVKLRVVSAGMVPNSYGLWCCQNVLCTLPTIVHIGFRLALSGPRSMPRFPAPSSKLCQNWLRH